jgi:hypothetical protein
VGRTSYLLIIVFVAGCAPSATTPTATPTATAVVVATPSPTSVPTTAAPSPTPGRHTNPVLGYAVTLPPSWRVSDCLSRIELQDPVFLGHDVLTWHTVAEEQVLGVHGGTGASGAFAWVVLIDAQNTSQNPTEFATARAGGNSSQVQTTTIDGKPAARSFDNTGNSVSYYVANAGRVYGVTLTQGAEPRPPEVTNATFDAIARSMTFVTPAARPTPTPAPVVTAGVEAVADAVAAAFAASDADRLRDLMTPRCWFNSGYNQSEGVSTSRDQMAASLRVSFGQGLKVTVEPRPIMARPPTPGSFWIWSTWSAYGLAPRVVQQSNVQLVFDQIDGRWYWAGALFNATR